MEVIKVLINPKKLTPNDEFQKFSKVRAVIENEQLGCFAISIEGGKCDKDEDELVAIQREIKEETGMDFEIADFRKILEIESMYDDTIDYRTNSIRPRHTITTYYHVKTDKRINEAAMDLTEGEIKEKFKISFVDRNTLFKMLLEDHSNVTNGKMFDEENISVLDNFLRRK